MYKRRMRFFRSACLLCVVFACALAAPSSLLHAQTAASLSQDELVKIEAAVTGILRTQDVPSAVVGIVRQGEVVYAKAFGDAQLTPRVPATTEMPYGIGSVSKQFTAAAVMVLVERGKLRLDDPVATWFPELKHAQQVTLRQLLNHVSGYSDYYTEDFLTPELAAATDPYALVKRWTDKPLDFQPGTKWQYSNTNYVLASLIVQKVAGVPFFQFLSEHVLAPAGLLGVVNLDGPDVPPVPKNYAHFAMGPARETPREGKGTLAGAGQLAMPIGQLALWDTVVLHRSKVLQPASWQVLQAEASLPDGTATGYGMGYFLAAHDGLRTIGHSGGLNGFTTLNNLYPDRDAAIAVVVNGDGGSGAILHAVEEIVFAPKAPAPPASNATGERLVRTALAQLQHGSIDRVLINDTLAFYFTPRVLQDFQASLLPVGAITRLELVRSEERGGMTGLTYRITGSSGTAPIVFVYVTTDGKLDQVLVSKAQ